MNFLIELLQFMVLPPSALLCFLPMRKQFTISPRRLFLLSGGFLALILPLGAAIVGLFGILPNLVLLPLLVILFFFYHYFLKSHFFVNASVFLTVMALMSFPSNIAVAIDSQIHPTETVFSHCILVNSIQLGITILFVFLFSWPFYHYVGQLVDSLPSSRVWGVTLPVPLIFILLNILMQPRKNETMYVNQIFLMYLCYLALAFFLFLILGIIFYHVANELLQSAADKERIRLFEMQEGQYLSQQRYIMESSRQRHDFRQQLLSMAQMAKQGNYEALNRHLSEYLASLPEHVITFCSNVPLNALLNYYASQMDGLDIQCNWKIALPDLLQITDTELCSLVGNILENVCHGCQTLPSGKRYHNLTIRLQHDSGLYIVSANSFDGVVKRHGSHYASTSHPGSGIGLSSIRSVAEKYHGMARFSHTGDTFMIDVALEK